jgi:hypothetical protein
MDSRRGFFKRLIAVAGVLSLGPAAYASSTSSRKKTEEVRCTLYRALNGWPAENLIKVMELMGGIEEFIGPEDVVVIKPNAQWWNQGGSNLSAMKALVDLIMGHPGGFRGEVVLAENCHRGPYPWKSTESAWAHPFDWNSDFSGIRNLNDLSESLKRLYGERFSVCHLIDVEAGGKREFGPAGGSGYIYCDGTGKVPLISFENGDRGPNRRATIMTYPVFVTDKGTVIDFKNGIWERGGYTGQPLRFINFPALNHHSSYCGLTGAVKNYLGVTDLSGGPDPHNGGRLTKDHHNFHSFPFDKWAPGPEPGMLGAEIGTFMKTIRRADLNITTAEWIGLSSRVDPPIAHTRAVLASTDPVALDYHSAKYLLYPNSGMSIHDPDNKRSPVRHYLMKCAASCGGIFDERLVEVISYNFETKSLQKDDNLTIVGEKKWANNPKAILKYILLRLWNNA